MKPTKKCLLLLSFISVLCSISCGYIFSSNDGAKAEKKFSIIFSSIINKDSKKLKKLFSKKAIVESGNIDDGIQFIFSLIKGDNITWERSKGIVVDESVEYGKRKVELKSFFTIRTNIEEYLVFVLDYTKDTFDPSNVGIYSLRVINKKNEKVEFGYWQDMKIPGIYKPMNVNVK